MVRISNEQNQLDLSKQYLSLLAKETPSDGLLPYEVAYLTGELAYKNEEYLKSIEFFKKAIPTNQAKTVRWYDDTIFYLGSAYVKLAEAEETSIENRGIYFNQAEQYLAELLLDKPDQRNLFALGQCYLIKSRILNDASAYSKAESLFSRQDILLSREVRAQALLLQAKTAPSFEIRDMLYRHLTQESQQETSNYAQGWYYRGLNEFEEGNVKKAENQFDEAKKAFERAYLSFKKSFDLLFSTDTHLASLALKYQAETKYLQETPQSLQEALKAIVEFYKNSELLSALEDPDEIYYIKALILLKLANGENTPLMMDAVKTLNDGLEIYPKGKFAEKQQLLIGNIYLTQNDFGKAREVFDLLVRKYPQSPLAGEALFWAARSANSQGLKAEAKDYLVRVYKQYPQSKYAAEAYFNTFTYREYLQGDRPALKHLESMPELYPNSIYIIHAHYLLGMDYKRDRKSESGKWLRKKNLNEAIDAFQNSESAFDTLYAKGEIPEKDLDHLILIRYRAELERALANLEIAEESHQAKKQIYLKYTQEVLQQILGDCRNDKHSLKECIAKASVKANIENESLYWLALSFVKSGDDAAASVILDEMLEKFQSAKITRGYLLSRAWYEKGMIASRQPTLGDSVKYLQNAEDASKGNILSTDEKLDLWIQQSLCYQERKDFDNAIVILSKVINDDCISSLRVKAMYLRAVAYELQGRRELARKQLEATSKKGGEWAHKAKEKLEKTYGYE